jgi:DNA-binding IclR family transcriptional regulator
MVNRTAGKANARKESVGAPSLSRGLAMLELLGESKRGLTLSEIARKLTLPKSTTHWLLATLRDDEYVICSEKTGRYFPGNHFFKLSYVAIRGVRLREQAGAILRSLHEATRLTVHLAIWDHQEVVLIEKLDISSPGRLATWVGRRMEVHCTGLGKAILAYLTDAELEEQLRDHGLPKHNENTLSTPKRLRLELEKIRAAGYAVDDEEEELGFRCVSAPVFGPNQSIIASISIAGTIEQVTAENLHALASRIRTAASAISTIAAAS